MATLSAEEVEACCSDVLKTSDGTEVVWSLWTDLESGCMDAARVNEMIVHARNRLALIYHRYICGEVPKRKLKITINGEPVPEYDPFQRKHNATQPSDPETIRIKRQVVKITSYILPHYSKLKQSEFENLSGDEGLL